MDATGRDSAKGKASSPRRRRLFVRQPQYYVVFSSRRRHTSSVSAFLLNRSSDLLTPSQLYVFMPPNLGGFFMVRSYYPSECHADYFDFERIEALKPAIEACGISTLSQSPMLGFHKQ